MELHAIHRQRAMSDRHDFPRTIGTGGPGIHQKILGQRGGIDDEAVVAGGFDGAGEAGERPLSGMLDRIDALIFNAPMVLLYVQFARSWISG